jgi:glucans biosynthesis protein C
MNALEGNAVQATARFHYMDNLRALAMLSGVVFHAALAYSPLLHPFFPTADRAQSAVVDVGIWFLHLFRMPLFFVVAGFFACMLVQRRGLGGFFGNRLKRIALPFVIFWPLVHLALSWSTVHAAATVQHPSPMLVMIQQYLQMEDAPTLPPGTGHLWFLYYLMIFYVLIWSARSMGLQRLGDSLRKLGPIWHLGLLPLGLVPALAAVSAPHPAPESLLPQFWALGFYAPFFAYGYLLFGQEDWLARARRIAPWLLLASIALYAVFLQLLAGQTYDAEDPSASLALAVLEAYISVWMTLVCLVAGRALLNRSNRVLRYLADASYWTYIIHLPVLFAIQYALMDLDWHWGLKFSVALIATSGICLLSYPLVVRGRFLTALVGSRAPAASAVSG